MPALTAAVSHAGLWLLGADRPHQMPATTSHPPSRRRPHLRGAPGTCGRRRTSENDSYLRRSGGRSPAPARRARRDQKTPRPPQVQVPRDAGCVPDAPGEQGREDELPGAVDRDGRGRRPSAPLSEATSKPRLPPRAAAERHPRRPERAPKRHAERQEEKAEKGIARFGPTHANLCIAQTTLYRRGCAPRRKGTPARVGGPTAPEGSQEETQTDLQCPTLRRNSKPKTPM